MVELDSITKMAIRNLVKNVPGLWDFVKNAEEKVLSQVERFVNAKNTKSIITIVDSHYKLNCLYFKLRNIIINIVKNQFKIILIIYIY